MTAVAAQQPAGFPQNTLIGRILSQAINLPDHDAIVTPGLTISYAHLARVLHAQIDRFIDMGMTRHSVIGIKCADDSKHLILCLAATHFGATTCTIPCHEAESTQKAVIDSCGASHIVDENTALDPMSVVADATPVSMETQSGDAALLFSTSGTTGEPKLVVHNDSDLVAQAHRHISSVQERFACIASMEQNFAKRHRLYCLASGASNVFLDADQRTLVAQCLSFNVNVLHVSAFQAQELLAVPDIAMLSSIRLKLGGSHVPLTLRKQLKTNITRNLEAGYGTTETGAIGFTDPNDKNAGESVGKPLPGIDIRIVTPDRKPLDIEERGEIAIRCEGMFRSYLGNPSLTSARLENDWFYTGDIGYLDKQRRIHICGRSDDMFLFNSMNIYPQDIESQVCQFSGVTDAAVIPRQSSAHGNIPVALVVFDPDAKPDLIGLKKFVRDKVGVRSPRQFTIVTEIPRNTSGKISRTEAMTLATRSEQVRRSIVQALTDACAGDTTKSSLLSAFEHGEKHIRLSKLGIDSLARMELMIALEINHDVIIMPHEFKMLRSLDDIVTRVLQPPLSNEPGHDSPAELDRKSPELIPIDTKPYLVRFFQRMFSYCGTATHLNHALTTFEARLTPTEFECLYEWHLRAQLIPADAASKFQSILTRWFQHMNSMMLKSRKSQAERFVSHRINGTVTHFKGPGSPADKTLLICFSTRGGRRLMIPNAVLMQHTDSSRYDLLVISEPLGLNYQMGVPGIGKNLKEVIDWLSKLELPGEYAQIRTLGCSAGGYAAVIAGHQLGAQIAVSVAGRFPSKSKSPAAFLSMILTIWRVMRKYHRPRVIISYAADKSRDRKFARIMIKLFGCESNTVEIPNEKIGHNVLGRLLDCDQLAPYLASTILAEKP